MSTNSIHIDNYEAFYLDYLEGNLNEADTALLLDFLQSHPELQLEDESLEYLAAETPAVLDDSTKLFLKFPDTRVTITAENIELFLVALVENQLAEEKIAELRQFLLQNPSFERELHYYQLTKLKPETNLVFPAKRSLKKGGAVIPMYFYPAVAAAASVLLIFTWMNNTSVPIDGGLSSARLSEVTLKHGRSSGSSQGQAIGTNNGSTQTSAAQKITGGASNLYANNGNLAQNPVGNGSNTKADPIILPVRSLEPLDNQLAAIVPQELNYRVPTVSGIPAVPAPDFAMSFDEMKNPIKPITKRIEKAFNVDVDVRTAKAAHKKQGGYFIKLGKFQISKRSYYDNGSVAMK